MPLNYSKWDKLELSDDSDIESHPNVDHKSLVRWKQRDIHEKREQRKHYILYLKAQIACNEVLLPRITQIYNDLSDESSTVPKSKYFSNLVEKTEKHPSPDCPPGNDPSKIEQTYDGMLLNLLQQVTAEAKTKLAQQSSSDDEKLGELLKEGLAFHVKQLGTTIEEDKKKLKSEEEEQKKKITSDDIKEGWDSSSVLASSEPAPVPISKVPKPPKTETVTEFETLNPGASSSASAPAASHAENQDEEDEEGLPELTPVLEEFSHLPLRGYQKSFEFLQTHREVFAKGSSDALLVAAFRAQSANKPKYAKKCIHQSLLLQYCDKLGPDGVRMFFNKMIAGDQRAQKVFVDDVENTYNHLVERVKISQQETAEESAGQEQIQLVAENPETVITFNVPDGPPPEELRLEGPGTEDLDIEEVRKALQLRWDVYNAFPVQFQEALKENSLDKVNKYLGSLPVSEAEELVGNLDMAGILSFAEGGIRDETGQGAAS